MDNAESPRGQPAKSGTTWQPRRSILISSHGREREDKLGFEGEKREGKESRKGERRRIWVEGGERRAAGQSDINKSHLIDLLDGSEYVLTYEDKDG